MRNLKWKIVRWYKGEDRYYDDVETEVVDGRPYDRGIRVKVRECHWTAHIAHWAVQEYKWIVWVILTAIAAFAGTYAALK